MNYNATKFFGISEIDYIYHGDWCDPEVRYKNELFNYYDLEDTLYDSYLEENIEKTFKEWVIENKEIVFVILDDFISNKELECNELK